jgi:predicted CopG family antitoxin
MKKGSSSHGYIIQKLIDQKTDHLNLLISSLKSEVEHLKKENQRLEVAYESTVLNLSDYILIDETLDFAPAGVSTPLFYKNSYPPGYY